MQGESVCANKHVQRQTERRSSSRAGPLLVATDPLSNQTPLCAELPGAPLLLLVPDCVPPPHLTLVGAALLTNPALRRRPYLTPVTLFWVQRALCFASHRHSLPLPLHRTPPYTSTKSLALRPPNDLTLIISKPPTDLEYDANRSS